MVNPSVAGRVREKESAGRMERSARWLWALAFVTGAASLIDQVIWQRFIAGQLGVHLWASVVTVSFFLVGLGIGGFLGGKWAGRTTRSLLLFGWTQVLLAVGSIAAPVFLSYLPLTVPYWARLVLVFVLVAPFAGVMGAGLPLIFKAQGEGEFFAASLGCLYFWNTLGAAVGAFMGTWVLATLFGLGGAVTVSCLARLWAAFIAFRLGERGRRQPESDALRTPVEHKWWSLSGGGVVFLSGLAGLGYETVWFRLLSVALKDSPYAFSTVVGTCLLGFALGPKLREWKLWRGRWQPFAKELAWAQMLIPFAAGVPVLLATAGVKISRCLGKFVTGCGVEPLPPPLTSLGQGPCGAGALLSTLALPALIVLPGSVLLGVTFPLLASYLAQSDQQGTSSTVGSTLLLSLLGNCAGALLTSVVFIPALGSMGALAVLGLCNLFLAGWLMPSPKFRAFLMTGGLSFCLLVALVGSRALLAFHVPVEGAVSVTTAEGADSFVALFRLPDGTVRVYINGLEHGVRPNYLYSAWAIEALRFSRKPEKVLVIGLGSGGLVDVLRRFPGVSSLTVVELSSTLVRLLSEEGFIRAGSPANNAPKIIIGDGRQFVRHTDEAFDLIIADPIRSTSFLANNFHSLEFLRVMGTKLNPGGVVVVGGIHDDISLPKTLADAFRYVRLYQYFAIASHAPLVPREVETELLSGVVPDPVLAQARRWLQRSFREDETSLAERTKVFRSNSEWFPHSEFYLGLPLKRWWWAQTEPRLHK